MYNLKRYLERILEASSVVGAPANIPNIREDTRNALAEVEILAKKETEQPQEMRDLFAAVALIAQGNKLDTRGNIASAAWDFSDAMMLERSRRIESRQKGV